MPSPPYLADHFHLFQELAKRMVDTLKIPLKEVKDTHHQLFDIPHSSSSSKIALLINETILDPARTIWQILVIVGLTCKQADKKYYDP